MGERDAGELRYTAFLSYSHKDAAAAGRLHRKLEAYRLPRRLVGTETARGPVRERLAPIFRDREELPAATDLSETVKEALAQSGALIILCSPHSAGSLWVAEEIETFRRLHPDRPILAAILDGDPPDCFPKALRAFGKDGIWHEPLATDLRPGRDGAHLGLLKLVAGITGVGLDALVQRDAARKIRRVTAVTGAALVALLIMTALTWFALDARREAERQRAEAEGLVEFMLTDLRARLRGVGRLDIMTAVNGRALDYYDSQDTGDLSADSLERRAVVLRAIGEDEIDSTRPGNLDAALAAFREAHRSSAEQLARAPNDPDRIFSHGQSEYWVGRIHELRRNWPEAGRYYQRYAGAAERLIAIAPGDPINMMEMGWGALNLGIVQQEGFSNPARAQSYFERAVAWFDRAAGQSRPRDQNARAEQAKAYGWLAEGYLARGLMRQSLAIRRQELRIRAQLHRADPANARNVYDLARAQRAVARLSSSTGDRETAAQLFLQAYQNAQWLSRHDPGNAYWLLLKANIECDLLLGEPGLPPSMTLAQLRRNIAAARAELAAQRNPNISISRCLVAPEQRPPVTH